MHRQMQATDDIHMLRCGEKWGKSYRGFNNRETHSSKRRDRQTNGQNYWE